MRRDDGMDLFAQEDLKSEPLAARMRPRTLDEYVGQEHIVGKGRLLRRAIQADQLSSVIFYGPPGTGKTTLARVIANTTRRHFSTLNAVLTGVKELRDEIELARARRERFGQGTILFVDEVHRWNKSQQDALLPWVENGTFIFIGATTENPFFEVNAALVSRSRIFQLKALTDDDLFTIARQALEDRERGYGAYKVTFQKGALEHLVHVANGDARSLLNALQLAVETSTDPFPPPEGTEIVISKEAAEESIQRKVVLYDKEGDYHFDVISAFIKSLRGSDPDAALYWLAKMVAAGEDPRYIFRRMLVSATEDVGLADPRAVVVVQADADGFDRIGMPEGQFLLAHAALYLATAPKSNSVLAYFDARKAVEDEKSGTEVPNHLRDASRDSKGFGHGQGYLYPHAWRDHWVAQQYLPSSLQGKIFYNPGMLGYEKTIHDQVLERREEQMENAAPDAFSENLSYSPGDKRRDAWVERTLSGQGALTRQIKEKIYGSLQFRRSDRVLVLGAGYGMLLWPAYAAVPEGLVVAQVDTPEEEDFIADTAKGIDPLSRPQVLRKSPEEVLSSLEEGLAFEEVIARDVLTRLGERAGILASLKGRITEKTQIVFAQTVPSEGSRLSDFADDPKVREKLLAKEKFLYSRKGNAASSWNGEDLKKAFRDAGYAITAEELDIESPRVISVGNLRAWLSGGYAGLEDLYDALLPLTGKALSWRHKIVLVRASLS